MKHKKKKKGVTQVLKKQPNKKKNVYIKFNTDFIKTCGDKRMGSSELCYHSRETKMNKITTN